MLFLFHILQVIVMAASGFVFIFFMAKFGSGLLFLFNGVGVLFLGVVFCGICIGISEVVKEILVNLNHINSPYPFARRKVAKKLAKDYTSESVATLAYAVVSGNDKAVIKIAIDALNRLHSQELIDTFCQIWEKTRHKDLAVILKNRRYIGTESRIRVFSALKVGKLDALKNGDREAIDHHVLSALEDEDAQIAKAASSYEPIDTQMKALFYFFLGEWQKYENLDFDQRLLAKAYKSGSPELQQRITKKSREEGRFELIKILTDAKNGFNVKPMEYKDWQAFVDILVTQLDKRQIWRFLYNAPAFWSKRLLDKLIQVPFDQLEKSEKVALDKLFNIAKHFQEKDFKPKISRESWQKFECDIFSYEDYLFDSLEASEDGQILATRKNDKSIYNLPEENFVNYQSDIADVLNSFTFNGKYYNHKQISPNEKILILGSNGETKIQLFSLPDKKHLKTLNNRGLITSLAISPNSHVLASSHYDWTFNGDGHVIHLWNLPSGKHLKKIKIGINDGDRGNSMLISPDNRILVSHVRTDKSVGYLTKWSLPDGNPYGGQLAYFSSYVYMTSFIISPNNHILCCGYFDATIHLSNLTDGQSLATLTGHTGSITSLVISSDSRFLASGSDDNTIRIWSLPDGEHLTTLTGHTGSITSLVISSDSRFLASASHADQTIRLWSSPTNIPISKFTSKDIAEIELKSRNFSLEEGNRNAFKFTLALIRLRQQFDIDIEDSSNNIASSKFDIEIE